MILADTDVLVDALKGREPARSRVAEALKLGALATTSITAFELISGARSHKQASSIDDLLASLPLLPFDEAAAKAAAPVRRELTAAGQTIGLADFLIAGIALSRALPLMTRNRRHFERVPELLLVDL